MNNICLIGNLTKDAELSFSKGKGTAVMKYTIAVEKNMNRKESWFINIVTFGKTAENLAQYMVKGTKVGVVGELQVTNTKGDDGKYKTYVNVVTSNVELLGGKKKENDPFSNTKEDDFEGDPVDDGDMPF